VVLGLLLGAGSSDGQEVRSRSSEPTSKFLQRPGEDRYADTDWSQVPAWDQAAFYGVRARGRVFVFVVDCSGSMADEARLTRAKAELRRTISALRWPQRVHVIFYNDRPLPQPGGLPRLADTDGKASLYRWLRTIDAEGGTEPTVAMRQALALAPDAVFLLSDGAFPGGCVESITSANPGRIPIHCIDLAAGAEGDDLERIAESSGGRYAPRH
jgi:hypothetical protein